MEITIGILIGIIIGFAIRSVIVHFSAVGTIRIITDEDGTYMNLEVAKGKLQRMYNRPNVIVNIEKGLPRK